MHGAVVPIAKILGTGAATDVAFLNIPQIYQDLMLVMYVRTDNASSSGVNLYFNGVYNSSTSGFTNLQGNGTSPTSNRFSNTTSFPIGLAPFSSSTSNLFSSGTTHILNYAASGIYKTVLTRWADDRNGSGDTRLNVGSWLNSTGAITQINIATYGQGNWVTGSTFTLYGIRTVGQ
jgi:hypothetical protein